MDQKGLALDLQLDRIERKLDEFLELAPAIRALSKVLIRSSSATKRVGLNKDTLSKNRKVKKFEQVGHRRTYIELGDLDVVEKRRR